MAPGDASVKDVPQAPNMFLIGPVFENFFFLAADGAHDPAMESASGGF